MPIGKASASLNFVFSITTEIVKKIIKNKNKQTNKKHSKIVMLARIKLNSIESTISKVLLDNEISHEDFTTIINEERNYCKLKENIRMMKSQRSNIEKNKLIKDDKKVDIDEMIRQNERINNNLKCKKI